MSIQSRQQIKFLSMTLGGPTEYKGKSMSDAHNGMGITEHQFGLVAGHLVATLKRAGVGQEGIDAIVAILAPIQSEIVMA